MDEGQTWTVEAPSALRTAMAEAAAAWTASGWLGRLWQRDPAVWTGRDEGRWLGWLDPPRPDGPEVRRLDAFTSRIRRDGVRDAALLGMGGSSLCPEMLGRMFGAAAGIDLHVLDSTDPARIRTVEAALDLDRTLFIVSSKSGTTIETRLLERYFFDRVRTRLGPEAAGARFAAVTDAGSALDRLAGARGYRAVFHGDAAIGGRYSAVSYFGLLPAAVLGIDVRRLLTRAGAMAAACGPDTPADRHPGVQLGLLLGLAARAGRDKATLVVSPGLAGLGAWIEQLLAESTGKEGTGILPIDGEALIDAARYGQDRLFVSIRLDADPDPAQEAALDRLAAAGHPVARLRLPDRHDVAAECFRWAFAAAVAGAVLGIHPFDQPDVEASKAAARARVTRPAGVRSPAPRPPVAQADVEAGALQAYAPPRYAARLRRTIGADAPLDRWVAAHLARLRPGDYVAVLAYVEMSEPHLRILDALRQQIHAAAGVATTLGFGPRFLHSTGQAHKGGRDTGRYLVVTCRDEVDLAVPGEPQTFGAVKAAQAEGDLEVLEARGRRWLRLHVDGVVADGLAALAAIVARAAAAAAAGPDPPAAR